MKTCSKPGIYVLERDLDWGMRCEREIIRVYFNKKDNKKRSIENIIEELYPSVKGRRVGTYKTRDHRDLFREGLEECPESIEIYLLDVIEMAGDNNA